MRRKSMAKTLIEPRRLSFSTNHKSTRINKSCRFVGNNASGRPHIDAENVTTLDDLSHVHDTF